jgi:amino acid adenylation domain-containing protein
MLIYQFLQAQLEKNSEAIAIKYAAVELTYNQLNNRVNQLANYLRQQGVKPEVLVGIYAERSLDIVIGILAILKAGGAYVALDPAYPPERLVSIAQETELKLILTQDKLARAVFAEGIERLSLDTEWSKISRESTELEPISLTPENLAYIMYTSGSTGKPQGVRITHGQIENYIRAIREVIKVETSDIYLHSASFAFSSSIRQLFLPLSSGAKVVIVSREKMTNPIELLELIQTEQISIIDTVSSIWHYILMSLDRLDRDKKIRLLDSQLKTLIFSGGLLTAQLIQNIRRKFDRQLTIFNVYGQTETIGISAYCIPNDFDREQGYLPVGMPYPHNQLYLLDDRLQPVLRGEIGELYVAGGCLARGYFKNSELDCRKFISNPFTNNPQLAKLYQTGDLARYLSDGNLELVGRQDFQVKIRGMRVEIEEIETTISQHPDVHQAAVIGREDRAGSIILVAYIVSKQNQINIARLRLFVKTKLPDYMIPSAFILLDELPLTSNNKLDRQRLPAPNRENFTIVNPRDELESQLIKIWEEFLEIKPIGIDDNFFDLGGHSLTALQLVTEIEKKWGKRLFLSSILRSPTISDLAAVIRKQEKLPDWSSLVPIEIGGEKPPLFCIHPVGGNLLEYYCLAEYLRRDRPIYGLQAQGIDGKQEPLHRIEDMASQFIKEIQTIQPIGPYFLIGYSFGGTVAFEIAQQLRRQGHQIGLLGLLDTKAPTIREIHQSFSQSLAIHVNAIQRLSNKEKIAYFSTKFKKIFKKKKNYRDSVISALSNIEMLAPEILNVLDANLQAQAAYIPQIYSGNILLFRSECQSMYIDLYPNLGWGNLIDGNIKIQDIPGDHRHIMKEPNVQILAQTLQYWLDLEIDTSQNLILSSVQSQSHRRWDDNC